MQKYCRYVRLTLLNLEVALQNIRCNHVNLVYLDLFCFDCSYYCFSNLLYICPNKVLVSVIKIRLGVETVTVILDMGLILQMLRMLSVLVLRPGHVRVEKPLRSRRRKRSEALKPTTL